VYTYNDLNGKDSLFLSQMKRQVSVVRSCFTFGSKIALLAPVISLVVMGKYAVHTVVVVPLLYVVMIPAVMQRQRAAV
jgi:hypothetical protein